MSDEEPEIKLVLPKHHLKAVNKLYQGRRGASFQRPHVQCDNNCPAECHRFPEIRKKKTLKLHFNNCMHHCQENGHACILLYANAIGIEEQGIFYVHTHT